jgi:DNA polymerase-3 subunit delta
MAAPKKKASTILVCFGNDTYWVETTAREYIAGLIPEENRVFGLDTIDGLVESGSAASQAIRRCLGALDTPPFLGGDKVVWLKGAAFLGASGRATRGQEVKDCIDRLTALVKKGLVAGVSFLVTAPSVDKRSAFYKACEKAGEVREFSVTEKSYEIDQQAASIIQDALRDAGLTASDEVVTALAEREGCDTLQIRNEVEKLRVYLGDVKKVTLDDVEAVVCSVRGSQPWDLADAVVQRDLVKALRVLTRLLDQKTAGVYIMAILEGRFKEFLVYREALDRGWLRAGASGRGSPWDGLPEETAVQLTAILGKDPRTVPGFIMNQRVRQAQAFKKSEILRIQKRLLESHRMMVTGAADEQWILEMTLIRILRRPAPRPR